MEVCYFLYSCVEGQSSLLGYLARPPYPFCMFTKSLSCCTSFLLAVWLLIYSVAHCPLLDAGQAIWLVHR